MRRGALVVVAAVAVLTSAAVARADAKKNEKFCGALSAFNTNVTALQSMRGDSTVAQLRAASARVEADARNVLKTAGKIKTPAAKQFTDSARQLRVDANQVPSNITIAQAQSRIAGDVTNVERAARQLAAEAGCPEAVPQPGTTTK